MGKIGVVNFIIFSFFSLLSSAAPLTVSVNNEIDFGRIEYTSSNSWSQAQLGTNGVIIYKKDFSGDGFGTPAEIAITDDIGTVIDINCQKNGKLSDGIVQAPLSKAQFVIGTANGVSYNTAILCAGKNVVAASHTITSIPAQDTLLVSARVRVKSDTLNDGVWQSTNANGNHIRFWVVVQ